MSDFSFPVRRGLPPGSGSAGARLGSLEAGGRAVREQVGKSSWLLMAYVLAIPLAAGVGVMRGDSLAIGGLNYTGFMWLAVLVAGIFLIVVDKGLRPHDRAYFAAGPWMLWLVLIVASFTWTDVVDYPQVRDILQLCMPVLVGIAASLFVRTREQLAQLIKMMYWLVPILAGFVFVWWKFDLDQELRYDMYVEIRGLALTAVFVGGVCMAAAGDRPGLAWLGWGACFLLTVLSGSRMASAAMLILPVLNPTVRGLGRRLLLVGSIAVIGLGAFFSPVLQDRFFDGGSGSLSQVAQGDFDSKGRFDVWPIVLEDSLTRPWFGHGACTVQRIIPDLWEDVVAPHNDYLRLLYEVGIVGLVLFFGLVLWQMACLARQIRRTDGVVRQAAAGAWLGLAAFLVIAVSDNPIMYALCYMNLVFVLIGAASAVEHEEALAAQTARHSSAGHEWLSPISRGFRGAPWGLN